MRTGLRRLRHDNVSLYANRVGLDRTKALSHGTLLNGERLMYVGGRSRRRRILDSG